MITVKAEIIEGIVTPKKAVVSKGFGTMFDGKNYLIFESQDEAQKYTPVIEPPKFEDEIITVELTRAEAEKLKELLSK